MNVSTESIAITSFESAYREFLNTYPAYRGTSVIDELRQSEYARLDAADHCYLDYTGGSQYAESQLEQHYRLLRSNIFGNPHSENPSSTFASALVADTRVFVLDYFNGTDDYYCIFTPNATGALKIVGESYPFTPESRLLLSFDDHNSVNGIREFARKKGAAFDYVPLRLEDLTLDMTKLREFLHGFPHAENKLFAFPAQSNVSGVQHDLDLVKEAQQLGWDVLLDAAAFVPTNKLDLKDVPADFIAISFYKIFGYPTGIGALLVRKDHFDKLKKPWFAGGTVTLASVMADSFFLDTTYAKFEDGTVNYLGIPAVKTGLQHIRNIGINTIHTRVQCLTAWIMGALEELRHDNGKPVVRLFGPGKDGRRGGTLIVNYFDKAGKPFPTTWIEQSASAAHISIRTGCFCNPGIDEVANCLTVQELSRYFKTHQNGDYHDMIEELGKLRGAVRISFGIASNFRDAYRFLEFARSFRNLSKEDLRTQFSKEDDVDLKG